MDGEEALANIAHRASAATWPFTAISTVLFGMRIWTRVHTPKARMAWDDAVILIAWILTICKTSFLQKAVYLASHHESSPTASFWIVFTDTWVFLSIAVPKLSIGLLLIQIFRPHRWLKHSIIGLCVSLLVLAPIGCVLNIVQCDPVAAQWDRARYPNAHCWDRRVTVGYACTTGALSAFVDLAFTVYPGFAAWQLKMPTWKKVSTSLLMSLGLCSFIFAVIKLYATSKLLGVTARPELFYHGIEIGMWNSIENDFVLSAACLPFAPPCFRAGKAFMVKHMENLGRRPSSMLSVSVKSSHGSDGYVTDQMAGKIEDEKPIKASSDKGGTANWFDQDVYSVEVEEHDFV